MSKYEFIYSASEDKKNGTEESETSDNKYFSEFTNPVFQKSLRKKTAQRNNHQIQKRTLVGLDTLSCILVVNTNR